MAEAPPSGHNGNGRTTLINHDFFFLFFFFFIRENGVILDFSPIKNPYAAHMSYFSSNKTEMTNGWATLQYLKTSGGTSPLFKYFRLRSKKLIY